MSFFGAVKRIRTADLFLTKEVLCLLSYNSECNELFQGSVRRNASSEKAYAFNCEAIRQVLITANKVSCFKVLSRGTQVPKKRMLLIAQQFCQVLITANAVNRFKVLTADALADAMHSIELRSNSVRFL